MKPVAEATSHTCPVSLTNVVLSAHPDRHPEARLGMVPYMVNPMYAFV